MKNVLILCCALLLTLNTNAQTFDYYNTYAYTNDIAIDAQGNKWLATHYGGLFKYDGTSFKNYTEANGLLPLGYNEIYTLKIEQQNNIWIGGRGGFALYNGSTFTNYTTANGLLDNSVYAIGIDNQNNKWIGTNNGLSKFDGTTFTNYTTANGLLSNSIHAIAVDVQGNIWIGTNNGLSKFDGTTFINYTTADGLINNRVNSIAIDVQGNKWLGTNNGLSKFDGTVFTNYTTANGLIHNSINTVRTDAQGIKWIGTDNGLSKYDDILFTNYNSANGLSHGTDITSIAIDAQDNKWIGCFTLGSFYKFDNTTFVHYEGLLDNYVLGITEDRQGNKWLSTAWAGITKLTNSQFYNPSNFTSGGNTERIAIDSTNNKWAFGRQGGFFKYDDNTTTIYGDFLTVDGFIGIFDVVVDKLNTVWVASPFGLGKYTGSSFIKYHTVDGLPSNEVRSIAIDAQNNKWLATQGGI
jgi:ligand-binding sensor domain-containing protein